MKDQNNFCQDIHKDIRKEIADARLLRVNKSGHDQGLSLPKERTAPLVPFAKGFRHPGASENTGNFIICEVKKKSPSKGDIAATLDPVTQAGLYYTAGIKSVSVLTEEAYFGGSLNDLIEVKRAYPTLSVLRKDFLLDTKDIDVSFRAGADAFLLIAGLLDAKLMEDMHILGTSLGMTPLVELHDIDDIDKAREFKPSLVGINSRNLKTFQIDPLRPLKIRSMIDWDCQIVYESGIHSKEDALFAFGSDFPGILVGEAVVRNPDLIPQLIDAAEKDLPLTRKIYGPWKKLFKRFRFNSPFVKVCGITNKEDGLSAIKLGADMIGFILAESPRSVTPDFIRSLVATLDKPKQKGVLRVGVVVLKNRSSEDSLPEEIQSLLDDGSLDFIQFHGEESPQFTVKYPGYKALRIKSTKDLDFKKDYLQPATLIDAFSEDAYGGTGKRIDPDLINIAKKQGSLWLAGGLTPNNIFNIISEFNPDLIDISSGLEMDASSSTLTKEENSVETKRKDPDKMNQFFKEIQRYENLQ